MALKTINGIAVASIKTVNGIAAASVKTWGGETWTHLSGADVFSADLTTGTGAEQTVTNNKNLSGTGGLVWTKSRGAATGNRLVDTVRGATLEKASELTSAEATAAQGIKSFSTTGFVLGTDTDYNNNTATYVHWTFLKTSGMFDIVAYTVGAANTEYNFNHSLGVTPELILTHTRNGVGDYNWSVWTTDFSTYQYLRLNTTAAITTLGTDLWNTLHTSTTFGIRSDWAVEANTNCIAYLFATLAGVSKVGGYTGDGSAGKVINCGFTTGARFVLVKRTDLAGDWFVWDYARGIVAGDDPHLSFNTAAAEVTTDDSVEADNSGFVVNQVAATNINVNTATYLYLAIA